MKWLFALLFFACVVHAQEHSEPEIRGPRWFQDSLIYFNDFENAPKNAALNSENLTTNEAAWKTSDGLFGRGLQTEAAALLSLSGAALSPHQPRAISFWWSLPRALPLEGAFSLFSLNGKGYLSAFSRGKGEWCALQKPAGVCQVYDFAGIQNVNEIYDFDLMKTLDLRAGIWHHSAAVLRPSGAFQFYSDGKLVSEILTKGRAWNADDNLQTLTLGGGVILDDVAILNRALDADFIADYFRGVKQLHDYQAISSDTKLN